MRRSYFYSWLATVTLAIALTPRPVSAQEDDSLSISGAFRMDSLSQGEVGDDLVGIFANGDDYGWPYCFYSNAENKRVDAPEYGGDGKITTRCAS